jgi:hypothetical protein
VARLGITRAASTWPPYPPTLIASRRSRGATRDRGVDRSA